MRALVRDLDDEDPAVRLDAVQRLRPLARRVDAARPPTGPHGRRVRPLKSQGLVPHLVKAAGDKVEANRLAALHALADTLDPAAVAALRAALKDDTDAVRLLAACLLTEYEDSSGLAEMKRALTRFREKPKAARPFEVERLLASFQRLTGKSFGDIPLYRSPELASDGRTAAATEKKFRELLDAWAAWWAWEPGKSGRRFGDSPPRVARRSYRDSTLHPRVTGRMTERPLHSPSLRRVEVGPLLLTSPRFGGAPGCLSNHSQAFRWASSRSAGVPNHPTSVYGHVSVPPHCAITLTTWNRKTRRSCPRRARLMLAATSRTWTS